MEASIVGGDLRGLNGSHIRSGLLILIKSLPIDFYFRFVFLQGTALNWHNVTKRGSEHSWRGFKRVKRVTLNWTQCAVNGPRQLVTLGLKGETRLNTCEDSTMKDTTFGQPPVNRNTYF